MVKPGVQEVSASAPGQTAHEVLTAAPVEVGQPPRFVGHSGAEDVTWRC